MIKISTLSMARHHQRSKLLHQTGAGVGVGLVEIQQHPRNHQKFNRTAKITIKREEDEVKLLRQNVKNDPISSIVVGFPINNQRHAKSTEKFILKDNSAAAMRHERPSSLAGKSYQQVARKIRPSNQSSLGSTKIRAISAAIDRASTTTGARRIYI